MKGHTTKKLISAVQLTTLCFTLSACGEQQADNSTESNRNTLEPAQSIAVEGDVSNQGDVPEIKDGEINSIFAEEEMDSESIIVAAVPSSKNLHTEPNEWYDKLVAEINEYTGMNVTWKWYSGETFAAQMKKDIEAGEVADVILVERQSDLFKEYVESGLFWEVGPYLDEYDNHAMTYEVSRLSASYNGKLYGLPRRSQPLQDGLGYRVDWLNKLGLEPPTDWESFEKMLYAFTYNDPDGNGIDDTVGLVLDSWEGAWDVMETWFGVPNVWGIDENGDLIHKSRTQEYRNAYAAFRKLYEQGVINNGTRGMADFREYRYWARETDIIARCGSSIDDMFSFSNVQDDLEKLQAVEAGEIVFDLCPCIDTGLGQLCCSKTGMRGGRMLVITTNRIKTEEQLKKVLQFLNDLNDAACDTLIRYGWVGVTYQVDKNDKNKLSNHWTTITYGQDSPGRKALDARDGFMDILTGFVAEENKNPLYEPSHPIIDLYYRIAEEYRGNCVYNYGYSFSSETEDEKIEELDAQLFAAEIQYITGEIDDAGFESALNAWWENGGKDITAEKNEKYHAAGN